MKSYNEILAALEARKDRSAWDKGVTAYAIDLLDQYQERAEFEGREAASRAELEEWLDTQARALAQAAKRLIDAAC